MPGGNPLNFLVTVYDTDGSTLMADVRVVIRNERTNETQAENTNSSGEVVFNLANFTNGWTTGDVISYYVIYRAFEASGNWTSENIGNKSVNLTLAAVAAAAALKIFTGQEFLDYFNLKSSDVDAENGVNMKHLIRIGEVVETDIETECDTKFDSNNSSYYTVTQEYHDGKGDDDYVYFVKKVPVVTWTTIQSTQQDEDNNSPTWDTLAENDDFYGDKETGRISIVSITKKPIKGKNRARFTYTHGRATVPLDIKQLAIVETGFRMWGASQLSSNLFKGRPSLETNNLAWYMSFKDKVIRKYRRMGVANT